MNGSSKKPSISSPDNSSDSQIRRIEKIAEMGVMMKNVTEKVGDLQGDLKEASKRQERNFHVIQAALQNIHNEKGNYFAFKNSVNDNFRRIDIRLEKIEKTSQTLVKDLHKRDGVKNMFSWLGISYPFFGAIISLLVFVYFISKEFFK